jgi:iron complex outermembrane receptor protein
VFVSALVPFVFGLLVGEPAGDQTPKPKPADEPPPAQQETEAQTITEIGGRLVISGEVVLVTANPDDPPLDSSIATRTDTPLRETPRSVSITTERTLADRMAINVSNAHDYTAGLMPIDDRGPASARGFRVDFYDLRRDGLRTYAWSVREPVALERIQYLRGPASVLYGDGSPGGLVNLVLKKPLPVTRAEVSASAGELGFARVTGDVTGPIGGNRRLRYRLVGASEWLDGGVDNGERRLSLVPTLAADLSDRVTLYVDAELYHQQGRAYFRAIPATPDTQHGDFSKIPWDWNIAAPDNHWSGWNASPGVRVDARLGTRSSLHAAVRYTRIGGDLDLAGYGGLGADGRTLNRFTYQELSTWDELQSDAFATTTLATGRIEHRLVAGVEAGLSKTDSEIGTGAAPAVDLYEPIYAPRSGVPTLRPTRYDIGRLGTYFQDQIRLHRTLIVVPAIRWSRLAIENRASASATSTTENVSTETAVSPSLGIVVLPRDWLSLYATGAKGFEPPTPGQYLEDGSALEAAESALVEGGVKADLLSDRIVLSSAVYRLRQTNVPEFDARGFYRQIGEGSSRGVETEATGSITRGLGASVGYAWNRTEIVNDVSGFAGRELPNAPRHKAHAWLRYRFTGDRLNGLMLAGGVVHVSDRFVARNNVTIAPAYTRFDASGAYDINSQLRVGVAVHNLTNVRYVTSGSAGGALYAGQPRRTAVQITTSF